jgi:hypothetical protein
MIQALVIAGTLAGPATELRWEAPTDCPTQAEVARRIAGLVGEASAAPLRVVFQVERRGETWHLAGEISGVADSGRRELSAASCEELADAAALIVAIAIDPTMAPIVPVAPTPVAEPVVEPEPEPVAVVEGPAAVVSVEPIEAESVPVAAKPVAARRRVSALVGVAGGLGLGGIGSPTGLLRLALGVRGDRWSAAVVQDVWLPRGLEVSAMPAYGGRFWLYSAGLRGCGVVPAGRVQVPLCATIAAGVMSGEGTGALAVSLSRRAPWVAASVGPGLRVPLGRGFGLLFAAELAVVLARSKFEITREGVVCCEGRVGGQFTGGIELRLP